MLSSALRDHWDHCPEDEEFFKSGQDADVMEEAISKFMDGMEAQERSGFKDLISWTPACTNCQGKSRNDAHWRWKAVFSQ